MASKTMRAGAFASVMMLTAVSLGGHATGAFAQNQTEAATVPVEAGEPEAVAAATTTEPAIRFVAEEVVQDVPEEPETTGTLDIAPNDAASLGDMVEQVMPVDSDLTRDLECLAKAVYFESRGEPLAGQLAVARVIMNRADSSVFPDDYCAVVTQRAQFSFVKRGRIPQPRTGTVAWERAKAIAQIAHGELWDSEAADSLYFHAKYVRPSWARHKSARATIDSHIFYR